MIRVLLADDHTIMRQGLVRILAETPDIVVVAQASNGQDAVQKVRAGNIDVVLLDISMPVMDGYAALSVIRQEFPSLPVIVLSMYTAEQHALRLLKAGAAGYLTKVSASDELIGAIRKVEGGGRYISQDVAEQVALSLSDTDRPSHELLSEREFRVMILLAAGQSIGEIAAALSLSPKTVSTYRARILEKLGLNSIGEIIRYAIARGLV